MIRRRLSTTASLLALLALLAARSLGAQEEESLDDLFDEPAGDTVAAAPAEDHLKTFTSDDRIKWTGTFTAEGLAGLGWTRWPDLADPAAGLDGTVGLTATVSLALDARPDPDFRLYGGFSSSLDPLTARRYDWPEFTISELFIDYTLYGTYFFRLGQQSLTWGQARLFENATNLMQDASSGTSLRLSLPTVLNGISAVALIKDSFLGTSENPSIRQLGYALKGDIIVMGTLVSAAARYQELEGIRTLFSVKRSLLGADLFADAVIRLGDPLMVHTVLAGFFKEWPRFVAYGEYKYDGTAGDPSDHTAGLVLRLKDIFGTPLDLGVQWLHAFIDGSGGITAGLAWKPVKFITTKIALPVAYGDDGTRYVAALNPDPVKRRLALALSLEFAVSF